jgi:hypothetical protein
MEIQEKHRLTILNAKCEYACVVDTLVKKMNYGEDVDCCINKLYLASRIINRLECYCFDSIPLGTEKVMSVFTLTESNSSYPSGTIGQIIVNGIQLYSATAAGTINEKDAISALLIGINYDYSLTSGGGIYTFVVTAEPNIRTITVMLTNPSGDSTIHNFKLNTVGVPSTTECNNCIDNSDLREMYALLNNLLA